MYSSKDERQRAKKNCHLCINGVCVGVCLMKTENTRVIVSCLEFFFNYRVCTFLSHIQYIYVQKENTQYLFVSIHPVTQSGLCKVIVLTRNIRTISVLFATTTRSYNLKIVRTNSLIKYSFEAIALLLHMSVFPHFSLCLCFSVTFCTHTPATIVPLQC